MTDAAAFWNRIAPKYATDPISDPQAYEHTLSRTISYLTPDDRALELGCGTGSTALRLAPHVQRIVGTDLSSAMIGIALERAEAEGAENTDFRTMSATEATRLDEPFTVVLAHNLIHLVRDPDALLAAIRGMLPEGALFISKTPCLADPAFGAKRFAVRAVIPLMQMVGKAPFVRWDTIPGHEERITAAGFEIVEAGNFPAPSRYIVARRV